MLYVWVVFFSKDNDSLLQRLARQGIWFQSVVFHQRAFFFVIVCFVLEYSRFLEHCLSDVLR